MVIVKTFFFGGRRGRDSDLMTDKINDEIEVISDLGKLGKIIFVFVSLICFLAIEGGALNELELLIDEDDAEDEMDISSESGI